MKPWLLPFLLFSLALQAQEGEFGEDLLRGLLEEESSSSSVELTGERLEKLSADPLNINLVGEDELAASGLFTPFQAWSLLEYRKKYGFLFTIGELTVLPGFRREEVMVIQPYLTLSSPVRAAGLSGSVRHDLTLNLEMKAPLPSGFRVAEGDTLPHFLGSPLRTPVRYRGSAGKSWDWGLVLEKDPGETLLSPHGVRYATGFLRFSAKTAVREIVAGSYRIRTGLGLVNGLATGQGTLFSLGNFSAAEIKPYAALNETDFSTGMAVHTALGKWENASWLSERKRYIVPGSGEWNKPEPDLFGVLDESGLQRTSVEETERATMRSAGTCFSRRSEHSTAGLSYNLSSVLYRPGPDTILPFRDSMMTTRSALSLYLLWFNRRLTLFGELAYSFGEGSALCAGMQLEATPFMQLVLLVRSYSKGYAMPESEAWSLGGSTGNETGFYAGFRLYPFKNATMNLLSDYAFFPAPRYRTSLPSSASRCLAELLYEPGRSWRLVFRYEQKIREVSETNPEPGPDIPVTQTRSSLRLDLHIRPEGPITCSMRVARSVLDKKEGSGPSWLVYQQCRWTGKKGSSVVFRHAVFHITDWDNRIYSYEPGLRYAFSFPFFYGCGQKTTVVLNWKTGTPFTPALKINRLVYFDRLLTGSGDDQVWGDTRWEFQLQLQLRF